LNCDYEKVGMDRDERWTLKAACIKAAATLVAELPRETPGFPRNDAFLTREEVAPDTGSCARYARDLFGKLTGEPWD